MDESLTKLLTEQPNPKTENIDLYETGEVLKAISDEDVTVAYAVREKLPQIEALTKEYIDTIKSNHRIFYIGCGTSGRLAFIDAAELVPTYSIPDDLVVAIMAGGLPAMRRAKEHAEDFGENGVIDLKEAGFKQGDLLIGIAASGRTPYVVEALKYAKQIGSKTGCIVCNENTVMGSMVDYPVEIKTGPEIVRGSTRMKAATAQKLTLNMISTTVFVRLGGTYKNLLMNGVATTYKAEQRHIRSLIHEAGLTEEKAIELLKECEGNSRIALTMALGNINKQEAIDLLAKYDGRVRQAVNSLKGGNDGK